MWGFLSGYFIGGAIGASRVGRFVKPALKLAAIGVLIAGLIYAFVFIKAINERSHGDHVHTHHIR